MNKFFVPLALLAGTVLAAPAVAKTSAAQWYSKCKAEVEREFSGLDVRRIRLEGIRVSDVRLSVTILEGERVVALCRKDRNAGEVIALKLGDQDWQDIKLSAAKP